MFKTFLKIAFAVSCVTIVGCSTNHRLGQFTAASTNNVRNLNYDIESSTKVRTVGKTCIKSVLGIAWGEVEDRLQLAMDDAIITGQNSGLDGDLLVNVRISEKYSNYVVYGSSCLTVAGDLVQIKKT